MGGLSIWHLIILVVFALVFIVPIVRIVSKAGYSGWWVLIWFVPFVGLVMLWAFAFSSWPALRKNSAEHPS